MPNRKYNILATLLGDLNSQPANQIKYGFFLKALELRAAQLAVYNADLQGLSRWLVALRVFDPNFAKWRQRFYKNSFAFQIRSANITRHLASLPEPVDVVVQIGTLFNAAGQRTTTPQIIYTDYTARLSAEKPEAGRSPFNARERQVWLRREREAFQCADYICTRSDLVRNSIIQDYQIPPEKVTVIGGGVNLAQLPQLQTKRHGQPPTALFIGKSFYRKGGDLLLKAFAQIRNSHPAARLVMVTAGPIPAELPREGVEFVQPTYDRALIATLFENADFFVLPSRLETWGDVLLEAMAYGLPCIGVAGDAMEEIIIHEQTGLIVAPQDVSGLAAALDRLFSTPELRRAWGTAGRQRIEAQFTWDHVADRLVQVIHEAIRPCPE